jgi:methylase of polypeptide subunit release factors
MRIETNLPRAYLHGHSPDECSRLEAQAGALQGIVGADLCLPSTRRVLEVGCGAGVQTLTLAQQNPDLEITAIDLSPLAVERTRARLAQLPQAGGSKRQKSGFAGRKGQ